MLLPGFFNRFEACSNIERPEKPNNKAEDYRKRILKVSSAYVETEYLIGGCLEEVASLPLLPESTHTGMEVKYATRFADNETVVVKLRHKEDGFRTEEDEREWRNTVEFQLNLPRSETLCEYYEVLETSSTYYIFMERVEGQDLFEQMLDGGISHVDAREIISQVLEGLSALHSKGRIHKDMKLENIVVDMNSPKKRQPPQAMMPFGSYLFGQPTTAVVSKVIDFDTVEEWESDSPTRAKDVLGSDGYIAPEAYDGEYSPASDIYAVGVIMYKLLTKKFPVGDDVFDDRPGENYVGSPAMKRIQQRLQRQPINFRKPPMDICPEAAELAEGMLAVNPLDRPSAREALDHSWFQLPAEELP